MCEGGFAREVARGITVARRAHNSLETLGCQQCGSVQAPRLQIHGSWWGSSWSEVRNLRTEGTGPGVQGQRPWSSDGPAPGKRPVSLLCLLSSAPGQLEVPAHAEGKYGNLPADTYWVPAVCLACAAYHRVYKEKHRYSSV